MRERKEFGERDKAKESREIKKKYFLVYEGEKSEVIYFDAINDLRQEIGINPIIELKPLIRSYSETGWSNPKKILERVVHNVKESQTDVITYETLINRIIDYLIEEEIITSSKAHSKSVWDTLQWYCEKEMEKQLTDQIENLGESCEEVCKYLEDKGQLSKAIEDITEVIKNQRITYEEGFDKICLIVDRDKQSFKTEQFQYVVDTCKKKGFGFYLTNPCFEFWLLLHFEEVFTLDEQRLLNNAKVSTRKKYAENELSRVCAEYKKSSYNAHILVRSVDKAIENEKRFCESIDELEYSLGSNLGLLIQEMRE